jgi:hypothetical protein
VILDTEGNIFGGFTPVKWESRTSPPFFFTEATAPPLKSFVFTLKNPHNIPARRFELDAYENQYAIWCRSESGPCFGRGCDIYVSDHCNTNTNSYTRFGWSYTNDTGLDGQPFSRVQKISKSKKSRSSRLQPKQHITQIFLFSARRSENREIEKKNL